MVYTIRALCSPMLCPPSMEPSHQAFPLVEGRVYTVGRSRSACDFVFEDARVSRRHCQLCVNLSGGGVYLVQGAGEIPSIPEKAPSISRPSLNGIYVDGRRLGRGECVWLVSGTVVSLVGPTKGLRSTDPTVPHPVGFIVVESDPLVLLSPKRIDARSEMNPALATNLSVSNGIDFIRIGSENIAMEPTSKRHKPWDCNRGHRSVKIEEKEAPENGCKGVEKRENTFNSALQSMLAGKFATLTAIASEKDVVNTGKETLPSPKKIESSSNGLTCSPLRPMGEPPAAALCAHLSESSFVPTLVLQREQEDFPRLLNAYPIPVSNNIDCILIGSESIAIDPASKRHKPCGRNRGHHSAENEETKAPKDGCNRVDTGEENTFTFNCRLNHSRQSMLAGKFATLTAISSGKDEDNTARKTLPSPEKIESSWNGLKCNPLRSKGELSGAVLCAHLSESSSVPTLALLREQGDFPRLLNAHPIPVSNGIDCIRIESKSIATEPASKRLMPCDCNRGHHSVENEETKAPKVGCRRVDSGEENTLNSRLNHSLQSISAGKRVGQFSGSTQCTDGETTLRRGFSSLSEKLLASSLDLIEASIKLRTSVSNKVPSAVNSYFISSPNTLEISENPVTNSICLGSKDRQSLAHRIACSSVGEWSESIGPTQEGGNLLVSLSMIKDSMGQCPPAADNSSQMVDCENTLESVGLGQASCLSLHWKHGTENNFEGSERTLDAHDKANDKSVSEIHWKHSIDNNFEGSERTLGAHNKSYEKPGSKIHWKQGIDVNFEGSDRTLDAHKKPYDRSGSEIHWKHGIDNNFEGSDRSLDGHSKAYDRSGSEIYLKYGTSNKFEVSDRTLDAHDKAYERLGSEIYLKHGIDKNFEGSDRTLDARDKAYERSSSEVHCKHGIDKNFEGSDRTLGTHNKAYERSSSEILGLMLRKPSKISADLVESTSCNAMNEGRRRSTGISEEESMLGRKEESTSKNVYARGWKPKTKLNNMQLFHKISAGMMRITSDKHDLSWSSPCQMKGPLARTLLDLGLSEGNDGNNKPTCDILLCHHLPSNPSPGSTEEAALRKYTIPSNCNKEDQCEPESVVSRSEGQLLSHVGGQKVVEVIAIEDDRKDDMQITSVDSLNNNNNNNGMCFETVDLSIDEATEMQGKSSCVALVDEMHVGRGVLPSIGIDKEDTILQTRKETSREEESLCKGNQHNNISESSRGDLLSCTESLSQINGAILDDKQGRQLLNTNEKEINCNIGEVNGPEMSALREDITKDAIITVNSSRGSVIRTQCAIDCRHTEFNKLELGQMATQEDRQSTHNEHNDCSPNVEESFLIAKVDDSDSDQIKHSTAHEFHDMLGKHEQVYHTEDIRMLKEDHLSKEEIDLPESDKKGTPQSTFDSRKTGCDKGNPDGNGSHGQKTSSCSVKNDHSSSGKDKVSKGIESDHYSSRSQDCEDKLDIGNPHVFGIHLNQLRHDKFNSSTDLGNVSLQQLLSPMEDLIAVFAATFTSDISWFLSTTEFPQDTPLTVACHNSERCWSASPADRWEKPSSDRPNLTLVYPPFPNISTSGKVSKSRGIGCHHPKLFLLRRKNDMRVIITSANLNSRQWLEVTNTVWWQDFPHRSSPNFRSLFKAEQGCCRGSHGDFASCLGGFLSALLVDVPSEAHWVADLAKYDFTKAAGSLVASIPGLHHTLYSNVPECLMNMEKESFTSLEDSDNSRFWHSNYLGVVATTVVGITHRFQALSDPKGVRLRGLAAILSEIGSVAGTVVPVLLKRARHITADPNAVSVLITSRAKCGSHELFLQDDISHASGGTMDSLQLFDQGCIQLGFLPKNIANWLAPLCDGGFFSYAACICPKEALSIASGQVVGSAKLGLYVFEGPKFSVLSSVKISEGIYEAISSLLKSLHRPYGLWRLEQILSKYKWPDEAETDFLFSSSSIGTSLDAPFLGAFSAAAGRRMIPLASSADSDPEWGCWTAECEAERPSIGIVFPTIERVKNDIASQYALLCFAERTWERLKSANLLHDAVPFPKEREGYPMHIKVGRRRFQSSPDAIPCGWVYTGSHNLSPAAWGRPIWKAEYGRAATSAGPILGSTLHIFNYELGIVFVEPPDQHSSGKRYHEEDTKLCSRRGIDKYNLPFVVPAPKYKPTDRPATGRALHEAYLEQQALLFKAMVDEDEMPSEAPVEMELDVEEQNNMQEMVDTKAQEEYAVVLWSQIGDVD